jgi:aspartyl protease family protein
MEQMSFMTIPSTLPQWQQLAIYAIGIALIIMLLSRVPFVGRIIRFAISLGLFAFLIFIVLQQAPYQPELSRLTSSLGLDNQQVEGKELYVTMAPDGHFWVKASINGVERRMLIDSGATVTAISQDTAHTARVDTGAGLTPVMLHTANGVAPARTGSIDELRIGNIVARNLRIVTAPGLGSLDVLGMNFLSQLESWRVEGRTLVLVPHHPQGGGQGLQFHLCGLRGESVASPKRPLQLVHLDRDTLGAANIFRFGSDGTKLVDDSKHGCARPCRHAFLPEYFVEHLINDGVCTHVGQHFGLPAYSFIRSLSKYG